MSARPTPARSGAAAAGAAHASAASVTAGSAHRTGRTVADSGSSQLRLRRLLCGRPMLPAMAGHHLFWIVSRAAGIAALLFSSAGVGAGLLMSGHTIRARIPDLRVVHEALSLATIGSLAIHAVSLLGDGFLHP